MTKEQVMDYLVREVMEDKTLDYKEELYKSGADGKKELLKDVTAMANTDGGLILIGVKEEKDVNNKSAGKPSDIPGMPIDNFEQWKQFVVNTLRDSCDPPLHSVDIEIVEGFTKGSVIALRVPKSWLAPHRVKISDQSYFFLRTSVGNAPMDSREIRQAFLLSDTAMERMKRFREDRVAMVYADRGGVPLHYRVRFMAHLLPMEAFTTARNVNIEEALGPNLAATWCNGIQIPCNPNFDGRIGYRTTGRDDQFEGYVQVFRNGCIEIVQSIDVRKDDFQIPRIAGQAWETEIMPSLVGNLCILSRMNFKPPIYIAMAFVGVLDCMFWDQKDRLGNYRPIDRDVLMMPELELQELNVQQAELRKLLTPQFDAVYQAAGLPRSPYSKLN